MRLLVLVTCYNNEWEVLEFAKECSKQINKEQLELIITINALDTMSIVELKSKLDDISGLKVTLYYADENKGYLNGMLFGYECFTKQYVCDDISWIVMCNTDIKYASDSELVKFLEQRYNDSIWCVAPSIYNYKTETYSNPHYIRKIPISKVKRNIFIFSHPSIARVFLKLNQWKSVKNRRKRKSQYVYAVHGCFFALRKEFVNYLVTRRFKALMYSEEAYIAGKLEERGKLAFYDSEFEVIHYESSVTGKLNTNKKAKYYLDSLKFILDENY